MTLVNKPCLVLSASFEPLAITSAKRAITLMVKEAACIVEDYGVIVHKSGTMLPSVIRLRQYRYIPVRVTVLTRKNIYSRDHNCCQYCGNKFDARRLTLDHVIPKSKGGKAEWSNLVAACHACNHKKADRTPEVAGMALIHKPRPLSVHTSRYLLRQLGLDEEENSWSQYLYA